MLCLGIESTAHTFGISIVEYKIKKVKVLANIIDNFTTEKAGLIPTKVADHHVEVCDSVLWKALETAKLKLKDVDLISYSKSPGMGHCLRIGAMFARSLANVHNKPVVGVNHCIAHLEIGRALTGATDPVLLYASGVNTQVIAYEGGKYRIFGETLDIGVGNFLDGFARYIGLGFPGGPKIEQLAKNSKHYIELPYVVKGMDVSFSGILTNLKHKFQTGRYKEEDLAYSMQETAFAMLVEVCERALAHCNKKELLLGGGVACNQRLQEMAGQMCKDRGAKLFVPEKQFLIDNAAMIAWLGIITFKANKKGDSLVKAHIAPYERTDDVKVNWR